MSIETESHLKISGNFLAIVLAMVFLGGTPAALIGLISILVGWIRFRETCTTCWSTRCTFITFPLVVGVAFQEVVDSDRDHHSPTSPSTCSSSAPSSPGSR